MQDLSSSLILHQIQQELEHLVFPNPGISEISQISQEEREERYHKILALAHRLAARDHETRARSRRMFWLAERVAHTPEGKAQVRYDPETREISLEGHSGHSPGNTPQKSGIPEGSSGTA